MTPNEKEILDLFKGVDKANAVRMSKKVALSMDYIQTLCNSLEARGLLRVVTPGRWPVYRANGKEVKGEGRAQVKRVRRKKVLPKHMTEVRCAYCKGKGTDPWGLMSALSSCQVCHGNGVVQIGEPYTTCPVCKGRGNERNTRVTCSTCKGKGVVHIEADMNTCPDCGGTGMTGSAGLRKYCLTCHGIGRVSA